MPTFPSVVHMKLHHLTEYLGCFIFCIDMCTLHFTFVCRINATESQVVYVYECCATHTPSHICTYTYIAWPASGSTMVEQSTPEVVHLLTTSGITQTLLDRIGSWSCLHGIVDAALPLHCHGCCPVFGLFVLQCLGPPMPMPMPHNTPFHVALVACSLVASFCWQILGALRKALHFLHSQCGICHRDLKPDNIVIQRGVDGKKIYKLTDFGLARGTPDQTMVQSVVGTRHYYAPEVVENGFYNSTVDLWSFGVIAYELVTGELPFIPHQTLKNIILNLIKKPAKCIAITEDPEDNTRFVNQFELPQTHHLSRPWAAQFTKWLASPLNSNYKERGQLTANNVPVVFADLDKILNMNVLTIFAVNNCERLEYAVSAEMTMKDLIALIVLDTGMDEKELYFVLPTSHPHKTITPKSTPLQLYVEEWSDTSKDSRKWTKRSNPPVMLYIFQVKKECDYKIPEPILSILSRKFIANKFKTKERWLQKRVVLDMLYVLTKEQARYEMLVSGINERALSLEDEMMENSFIDSIDKQRIIISFAYDQLTSLLKEAQAKIPSRQVAVLTILLNPVVIQCFFPAYQQCTVGEA